MPEESQKRAFVACNAGARDQTRVVRVDGDACFFQSTTERVHPEDVAKLACCISLATGVFGRFRCRVCKLFRVVVDGIWQATCLRWVVGSAAGHDDSRLRGKVWPEKVEEQSMADMVDREGLLDALFGVGDFTRKLKAGVQEQGLKWWVLCFGIASDELADIGGACEIEGEILDVLLADGFVDGCCGRVGVFAGNDQDLVLWMRSGESQRAFIA